jgi:DNA-binding SARP family transcriptional activator
MSLDVSILGPIKVTVDGQPVPIGDKKPRLFFGILAHELRIVENARLKQCLWNEGELPSDPGDAVQTCAKDVRAALAHLPRGRQLLKTVRGTGYQLMIEPGQVDKHRFVALKSRAEATERRDPGAAARLGRRALREWSSSTGLRGGTPLESDESRMDGFTQPLRQQHRAVSLLCIRAELACGRHRHLLPELARLEAEDYGATDADLTGLHMLALFRAGLAHEAAAVFERHEAALGDIGGFRIVKELKELRNRILNDDDKLKLDESDFADYGPEESLDSDEESTPDVPQKDDSPATADMRSYQYGPHATNYQAVTMNFDQRPGER